MRLRAVLTVPVTAIAVGALMLVTGAFGQGSSVGSLALQPGVNMGVSCPNPLSNANLQPNSLTVQCADNPNTSNSSTTSSTTTTAPATTTTVPSTSTTVPPTPSSGGLDACGLTVAAFCETFDNPSTNPPSNSRSGQLNGILWGTSIEDPTAAPKVALGAVNDGTQTEACGNTGTAFFPNSIQVCGGRMEETSDDVTGVTTTAAYPRQPFDFAGRTGTVTFDVSNNTQGSHAAWPEFWITDQPVPAPFAHESSLIELPKNGVGIRFAGCTDNTGNGATCPRGDSSVGVDSAITVTNYTPNDSFNGGSLKVIGHDSVTESLPGQLNHYEIQVSKTDIEVYGTDAFSGVWDPAANPVRHLASIPVSLNFTRGLIWLEDAHYNADKFSDQRTNTFQWDNVGFDGPVLPRDLGFDVPANTISAGTDDQGVPLQNQSYAVQGPTPINVPVTGITANDLSSASAALLVFNFYSSSGDQNPNPQTIHASVNGHDLSEPWPYPDNTTFSPRTLAIPVPLTDLQAGNNTVSFAGSSTQNYTLYVSNIDLILAGAGGTG